MFISIIVPVFNTAPAYIRECLESIGCLAWPCSHEVIVINDGSTDKATLAYLQTLSADKYRLIHQPNQGLAAARNAGIHHARGRYIFPLDSDDKVHQEILYFIDTLQQNSHIDVLHGDIAIFGDRVERRPYRAFHRYDLWLRENCLLAGSLYKRALWLKTGGYDASFKTIEDWDFWSRCAAAGAQFTHIPYCNYYYRIINDGQSLIQRTQDQIPHYYQKMLQKLSLAQMDFDGMNEYLLYRFRQKKRKVFGLMLLLYTPKLYAWLCGRGWFGYRDRFLQ